LGKREDLSLEQHQAMTCPSPWPLLHGKFKQSTAGSWGCVDSHLLNFVHCAGNTTWLISRARRAKCTNQISAMKQAHSRKKQLQLKLISVRFRPAASGMSTDPGRL